MGKGKRMFGIFHDKVNEDLLKRVTVNREFLSVGPTGLEGDFSQF